MKPRFKIGDYVEVEAVTVTTRSYRSDPESAKVYVARDCIKKLVRKECKPHTIHGWIVGAVRRHEGVIKGTWGEGDRPYLQSTGTKLLWKVAQSMMNTPVEAAEEDIKVLACVGIKVLTPMRLGDSGQWDERARTALAKDMKGRERDAKGRWLKEKHTAGIVVDVPRGF